MNFWTVEGKYIYSNLFGNVNTLSHLWNEPFHAPNGSIITVMYECMMIKAAIKLI